MAFKNVAHRGFGHVSQEVIKERCIYLHNLNPSKRCEFVKNSYCDEGAELVLYHHILFCGIPNPSFDNPYVIAFIFGMLVWIIILFIILAVTVDEYFCPAIGVLSKIFHLSENLSGVTLLALGNGSPDILSAITSATKGDTILMYNQVLGGGMFVSCVIPGFIALSRPFYLQPYHFLRDISFTLGAIVWIHTTTADEEVTIWEASSYIAIYILYLTIVIGGFFIQEKLSRYVDIDEKDDVDWTELRKATSGILVEAMDINMYEEEPKTAKTLFKDFFISLNPIHKEEWMEMSGSERFSKIIKVPFIIILNLIIPVVSPGVRRNGWSKLLNCFHCLIFPTFLLFATKLYKQNINGLPIFVYVSPVGLLIAAIVFCTSRQDTPPRYHCLFAFMSFIMGIFVIYIAVQEVVSVLNLLGTLCQITPQTLGLTILAWGNSLGDAVANIQIAKQGFQRMAFAGCFAGILANTMLSMGITFLIKNLDDSHENHARGGVMGPNCSIFFMMALTFSIIYVLLTKFQARKSYGIFLILVYSEFILFCLLCEFELIHPLGTDHEFSIDIFKGLNVTHPHERPEL